jgi:hypothetical protein
MTGIIEALSEEGFGVLCGLPPGTVTIAQAAMGSIATTGASTSVAEKTVEKKSSGLSKKEKEVLTIATLNLADTVKKDHPRLSDKACTRYAMKTILAANAIYSQDGMKSVLLDAVQPSHAHCRKVLVSVAEDYKRMA